MTATPLTLQIEGMTCDHCVRAVQKALRGLDGVEVEAVGIGSARVLYDPALVNVGDIVDAVSNEGYVSSAQGAFPV